jgi:predicted anti-sigma-YlaC factor YlaD
LDSLEEEWCLTMRGERISCRDFVEFVGDYYEGDPAATQSHLFEAHLGQCQNCRMYFDAYRETVRSAKAAMRDLDEQPVPEELVKAILFSARSQRK